MEKSQQYLRKNTKTEKNYKVSNILAKKKKKNETELFV